MLNIDSVVPEERSFVLSDLPPTRTQKRLAIGLVLGLLATLYLVLGPLGGTQLGAVPSFVAVHATAVFVTDSITAILLYTQFSILRSRAILVIASGYLFTALLLVPYVFAFPDVLAPNGVVGGLQTSAHLYLLWHSAFPLFVIGYALLKDEDPDKRPSHGKVGSAILRSLVWTGTGAAAVAVLCIRGPAFLPRIMLDQDRFVPEWPRVVGAPIITLCTLALVVLWLRRRAILDLFLMVVLCAYVTEIPPQFHPFPVRFSNGWYAVRLTSLLSGSIVMVVLLFEITAVYGGLLGALLRQRREREARLMTRDAVAASIAHEVTQPLTAMVSAAGAGLRFLDRTPPNLDKAMRAFRNIVADGHRASAVIANIRDNFRSDVSERTVFDLDELIHECLTLGRVDSQQNGVIVRARLNRHLPEIRGNRVQLQQVLLNLITNAIDAMAAKETPRILTVESEAYEDDQVTVSVADTGPGIRSEYSERLFNSQFTTKSDGMGLGLSICRAIIEAHEGELWVSANSPQGARFQFTLPAHRPRSTDGSIIYESVGSRPGSQPSRVS